MTEWRIEITDVPEFNEKFPSDPVDWDAYFVSEEGNVIAITIPGTTEDGGDTVRPVPREVVERWLQAMGDALIAADL
jgi:hypothetical protein